MRNLFKNKLATWLIVIATFVLAGVAVFTAMRLYQLRDTNISPSDPGSSDASGTSPTPAPQSCTTLTFTIVTTTPTPTTSGTVTPTISVTVTPTTPEGTATPTPSQTVTPTTPPGSTATPTTPPGSTATPIAQTSPTPGSNLPNAGDGFPTLLATTLGGLFLILSIALAF